MNKMEKVAKLLKQAADLLLQRDGSDADDAMPAYRILNDIPGIGAGTVFVHDKDDRIKGSPALGCLKNAWDHGNCQKIGAWCAETHVFPGQMAEDTEWFKRVPNDGRYYCNRTQ